MIRAVIFDLDGTLVQTEKLKALSYAKAVVELCPQQIQEDQVIEAFKQVVGLPRKEVAERLIELFELSESIRARMGSLDVRTTWQAFVQIRLAYYEDLLSDPEVLRKNKWPHTMSLLQSAEDAGCLLGLATMSRREQAQRVLGVLGLENTFDFVATRDDVERGKPDPEIYHLVSAQLGVPVEECLVIEDSPGGVQAAIEAGMWCIAVTTPFTRDAIRRERLLPEQWIVDDPVNLPEVARKMLAEREGV